MVSEKEKIGNLVHTRATNVMNDAGVKRLYGDKWRTIFLTGTVQSVDKRYSSSSNAQKKNRHISPQGIL